MARKPWTGVAIGIGLVAIFTSCVGAPVWFAVDSTIALATTEPVRITDVGCVIGTGRGSSYCVGSWTLANGDEVRERLSSDWFVGDGDTFDGYGNHDTAAPTRLFWFLAQLLYAIPILLVVSFIRFHRRRLRGAGQPLAAEDEAAMTARAEAIRHRREEPPALSG